MNNAEKVHGQCCYCGLDCVSADDYSWVRDGKDVYHGACLLSQPNEEILPARGGQR